MHLRISSIFFFFAPSPNSFWFVCIRTSIGLNIIWDLIRMPHGHWGASTFKMPPHHYTWGDIDMPLTLNCLFNKIRPIIQVAFGRVGAIYAFIMPMHKAHSILSMSHATKLPPYNFDISFINAEYMLPDYNGYFVRIFNVRIKIYMYCVCVCVIWAECMQHGATYAIFQI